MTRARASRAQAIRRDALISTLRQRKLEELQTAYLNAMLDRNGLAINEVALRKALAPAQ